MEITYFGLNAVRLRGREATVMIDPYEPKLGLAPVRLNVQIVIFTHEDPTHFSLQGLAGEPHLVTGAGEFEIKAIAMTGTQTYHDAKKGAERGKNFIYTVEIDDLRICHLGHLGHGLSEDQLEGIGSKIDVLFVPIGTKSTSILLPIPSGSVRISSRGSAARSTCSSCRSAAAAISTPRRRPRSSTRSSRS